MGSKALRRTFAARLLERHDGRSAIETARDEACKFLTSAGEGAIIGVTERGDYVDEFEVVVWFWGRVAEPAISIPFPVTAIQPVLPSEQLQMAG